MLDERDERAEILPTDPAALTPADPDRPATRRSIDHLDHDAALTCGNHPSTRVPRHRIAGLHLEDQLIHSITRVRHQVVAEDVEDEIPLASSIERDGQAQVWLVIVEILGVLEVIGGRSPLIIADLGAYPQLLRPTGTPTLNSNESGNLEFLSPDKGAGRWCAMGAERNL